MDMITPQSKATIVSVRYFYYNIDTKSCRVKSLNNIKKEHAQKAYKLYFGVGTDNPEHFIEIIIKNAYVSQYLMLLGYALPQVVIENNIPVTYSVSDLVANSVFKIRE